VFLGVETDDERRDIDYLLSNAEWSAKRVSFMVEVGNRVCSPDVSLPNQNPSVVNRFRKTALEHLSLQPALQEVLDLERQHVIKAHLCLVEHTNADESPDERIAFEKAFRVFVVELEQLSRGTTDFG
jgi:hypothetical protein